MSLDKFEEMDRLYWSRVHDSMKKQCGMGKSVVILWNGNLNRLYLGYRYHDMGGTDYESVFRISMEIAKFLMDEKHVSDVFGTIRPMIDRVEKGLEKPFDRYVQKPYQMEFAF